MKKNSDIFEKNLSRLEEITALLEAGNSTLDESIKLYDEGCALLNECNKILSEAEQKVTVLKKDADGNPVEEAFQDD